MWLCSAMWMTLFSASTLLGGCDKLPALMADADANDFEDVADLDTLDTPTDVPDMLPPPWPTTWQVSVAAGVNDAIRQSAQDVVDILGDLGVDAQLVEREGDTLCLDGVGQVVLAGQGLSRPQFQGDFTNQSWRVFQESCGTNGVHVVLAGRNNLARQHAVYDWLHQELGVRFYHPEETYIPATLPWPMLGVERQHTPPISQRGVLLEREFLNIELGDGVKDDQLRRYVDWSVHNLSTMAPILDDAETLAYAQGRGLSTTVWASLGGEGGPLLHPDTFPPPDDSVLRGQLADMIDDAPGNLLVLDASYAPMTLDDPTFAAYLHFIGAAAQQALPRTQVMIAFRNDETDLVARYTGGIRSAPTSLGLLFEPGPIVDALAQSEAFFIDRPVAIVASAVMHDAVSTPVYQPTVGAEIVNNLDAMRFMTGGRFDTHIVRVGAQEWGAWQSHYCTLRAPAFEQYRLETCLQELTSPFGDAADRVQLVIADTVQLQDAVLEALAGEWLYGRRLPPSLPYPILAPIFDPVHEWKLEDVEHFESAIAPKLEQYADGTDVLLARLSAVSPMVPSAGQALFAELFDSIQVTGLRARHALHIWSAVAGFQRSRIFFETMAPVELADHIDLARELSIARQLIVDRRQEHYRYPLLQSTSQGMYLENANIGRYHQALEQAADAHVAAQFEGITIPDVVLQVGEPLSVTTSDEVGPVTVHWDKGENGETGDAFQHVYLEQGEYQLRIVHQRAGLELHHVTRVAVVDSELSTGFSGRVIAPSGADVVDMVLPALVVAPMAGDRLVLGIDIDESGDVLPHNFVVTDTLPASMPLQTLPSRLVLAGVNHMAHYVFTSLVLTDMVLTMDAAGDRFEMSGQLRMFTAVQVIMAYAGFNESGAIDLLAGVLGYDPEALPEQLPFLVEFTGTP